MADIKFSYPSPSAITITLASLANDSTNLLAGRGSLVVDNSSSKYLDYLVGGKIKAGTSPTTGRVIEVWAYAPIDGATGYPDAIDGTDANISMTSRDIVASALRLVASMATDNTTGRVYPFAPVSIASLFGGVMPPKFGLWVVQSTGVALDATGSNHAITAQPTYMSAA